MMSRWCLLNFRSIAPQAEKKYLFNYRACMGTPLQKMHENVHMITNFSAINDLIQNKKMIALIPLI